MMKRQKGFTLVELIVVIAILAILAVLAVPRFTGTLRKSQYRTHNANVRTIESAVSIYEAEEGKLPDDINALVGGNYLKEVPTNPMTKTKDYEVSEGVVSPGMVDDEGNFVESSGGGGEGGDDEDD